MIGDSQGRPVQVPKRDMTGAVWRPKLKAWFVRTGGGFAYVPRTILLVWQVSKWGTTLLVLLTLVSAGLPVARSWVAKLILDAVVAARSLTPSILDGALSGAKRWVIMEVVLIVCGSCIDRGLTLLHQIIGLRLSTEVNLRILQKATSLTLSDIETPEYYDKSARARREASSRPLALVEKCMEMMRNGLMLTIYGALMFRFNSWLVLALVVAGIPSFVSAMFFSSTTFKILNRRSPEARRLNYIGNILSTDKYAKEVQLFNLSPIFLNRYRRLAEASDKEDQKLATRRTGWSFILSLLSTGAYYACYIIVVIAAATRKCSLGEMTFYLAAFRNGRRGLESILEAIGGMYEDNLYMANLFSFLDIAPTRHDRSIWHQPINELGIRFLNVGFCYPDAKKWALEQVSLFIPQGLSLAVVGENGAGKTTLIKLLTRLYEPTEGQILLDGRDIRAWDIASLRARMSVIFQDFNRYNLSLRDNIAVGEMRYLRDDHRIIAAAERGGVGSLATSLHYSIDTQLGRAFENGIELSGGQWQKIALARAFIRDGADIFILDEPTAALDAKSEQTIFERFQAYAKGRTAIIITHRFPTARIANQIIVLEHGHLIEKGSHLELLEVNGTYARLFAIQANGYR
jgi:ABC-type multidrug transport system fused ATPase/permease subunit